MFISFSNSSVASIAQALQEIVDEHLSSYESEIYTKLKEHEHGGLYAIEDAVEQAASDMAEEFHGDIEAVVTDYFDRHTHWQSESVDKIQEKLDEAIQQAEDEKEDEDV